MINIVLSSISLISASCSILCKLHLLWLNRINRPPLCAATVVLFCMAALIFPMGFYIKEVGGQPYKLPNNTVVGSSYVLFVLSIFFTIVGLLFAGKVCLPGWWPHQPWWGSGGWGGRALLEELLDLTHPRESSITCRAEQNWGAIFSLFVRNVKNSQEAPPQSLPFVQRWRRLNWPLCVIHSEQWDWQVAAHNGEWIKIPWVGRWPRFTFHSCWNSAWRVVERSCKWDLFHGASVRRRTLLHCIYYWFMFSLLLSNFVWKWPNSSWFCCCNQFTHCFALTSCWSWTVLCSLWVLNVCMRLTTPFFAADSQQPRSPHSHPSVFQLWVSDINLDMHQPPDWTAATLVTWTHPSHAGWIFP